MGYNILLVDDSATVRSVIAKTLRMAEVPIAELYQAGNGQDALEILATRWIDLVLADINMPIMNGIEMIDRMAHDRMMETIPVVVVSTEGSQSRIEHLKGRGVRAWIRKPFTPELVRDIVNEVLCVRSRPVGAIESERRDPTGEVARVFCEVLGREAYVLANPLPVAELPQSMEGKVAAEIVYTGGVTGSVTVAASTAFCRILAANMLGTEHGEEVADRKALDAFAELVNVVGGHLATALAGVSVQTNPAVPVLRGLDEDEWRALAADEAVLIFVAEELPILLRTTLKGSAA